MPAGSAWPMISTCMLGQGEKSKYHIDHIGLWIGPDALEHNDHNPGEIPGEIVAIGRPYDGPNLVLWTGTRHQVVLTLIEG